MSSVLTTHRVESWRIELLDSNDKSLGDLDGALSCTLDTKVANTVSGGGNLSIRDRGQGIDWMNWRVKPWRNVAGYGEWPVGIYLLSSPYTVHDGAGRVFEVALLDKLQVLVGDKVEGAYTVDAGEVVTDAVIAVIQEAGETAIAVADSTETLTDAMVWPAGTSRLQIANDLLASINYFSLRCDNRGRYVSQPYQAPAYRRRAWTYSDRDGTAVHLPAFDRSQQLDDVPNKYVGTTLGTPDEEGLVAVATDEDPASPYSYSARGNRWIVDSDELIEATSQEVLQAIVERRLAAAQQRSARIGLSHAALPLWINDVVRVESSDINTLAVVQSTTFNMRKGSHVLDRTVVEEVVEA